MAALILPSTRIVQPQGSAEINYSNPIAASSTVIINPAIGQVNLVNGKRLSSTVSFGVSKDGRTINQASTPAACNVNVSVTSYPFAIYFLRERTSASGWLGLSSTASNTSYVFLREDLSSTTTVSTGSYGDYDVTAEPQTPVGRQCAMLVCNSATSRRLFINGALVGTGSVSQTASFDKFNLGGIERTAGGWLIGGNISNLALAGLSQGLVISDAQAIEFTKSPWKIFKPKDARLWSVAAGGGTSPVSSDAYASYLIRTFAQQDLAASYGLRGQVASDEAASYFVRGQISSDKADSYNIRTSAQQDVAAAYLIRGAAQNDLVPAYSLRGLVSSDEAASYSIRGAVTVDLAPSYSIQNAGTVASDLSQSFNIRGAASADVVASYVLRSAASADIAPSYNLRANASKDLDASYLLSGAVSIVSADLVASYLVDGVAAPCPTASEIAAAVWSYPLP